MVEEASKDSVWDEMDASGIVPANGSTKGDAAGSIEMRDEYLLVDLRTEGVPAAKNELDVLKENEFEPAIVDRGKEEETLSQGKMDVQ